MNYEQFKTPTQITIDTINMLRKLYIDGITTNASPATSTALLSTESTSLLISNYLEILKNIVNNDNSVNVNIQGKVRIPTMSIETNSTNSPVVAGASSVTFITSSDFVGSIFGNVITPNASYSFNIDGDDTLDDIIYTVTAGSLTILKIT